MAGLNETPSGERVHIGFFGVRNAGKSSLVNAVTGQDLAVVSATPGTTTDPVCKAMELLPVGPVLIVDTPGLDDTGELGALRVGKARRALDMADVAVLVVDATHGMSALDGDLVAEFQRKGVPYAIALNKADALSGGFTAREGAVERDETGCRCARVQVSALERVGVEELKRTIAALAGTVERQRALVSDLVKPGDAVVLVVPIDSAAPKGRIILPQQQVIRDLVEAGAHACVTSVEGLPSLMESLVQPPRLVITDSQAFGHVARIVPDDVPLTSFSILMARYKGTLEEQVRALSAVDVLRDDDIVLIAEGCTHHRQCQDIGTVKLPVWIREACGANPRFEFASGGDFPEHLGRYAAVVHCGGCMLNAREMEHRAQQASEQRVPFTNYGMVIAKANGVFDRAIAALEKAEGGLL